MHPVLKNTLNPYFLVPFILSCISGGFLLVHYDSIFLFSFINQKYHPVTDLIMELLSRLGEGWMIGIIACCFLAMKPFRNPYFFAAAVLCTVIPSLITQIVKYQVAAPRPMTVYQHQNWVHHLNHWALLHNNSFPSGHTTGAFSFFCLLASVMPPRYKAWGFFFFIFALMTGYARVYLAAHFFADIYAGSIIGTVFSLVICQLIYYVKYKNEQKNNLLFK